MTAHTCPSIPEVVLPTNEPLRCTTCGVELRITCGNEGCPPPLPARNQVSSRAGVRVGQRTYQPKECVDCRQSFVPTGPRDVRCVECKAGR